MLIYPLYQMCLAIHLLESELCIIMFKANNEDWAVFVTVKGVGMGGQESPLNSSCEV